MAEFKTVGKMEFHFDMKVSEDELRALDALAGYGDDAFLKTFYMHLGETYMKPYEKGMREFLQSIRKIVPRELSKVDAARKMLDQR